MAMASTKKRSPFERLGLDACLAKIAGRHGWKLPTPIQRQCIPIILKGRDIIAMARTGSGKTGAYMLPLLQRFPVHSKTVGIRVVILCPTRELAIQSYKELQKCSQWMYSLQNEASKENNWEPISPLRIRIFVGGEAMEKQFEHLSQNPDVVIATPGRWHHHLIETEISCQSVEMVIVDEADQVFDFHFEEQIQPIWKKFPSSIQTILLSATLPPTLVQFSRYGIRQPTFIRLDVEQSLNEGLEIQFFYVRSEMKVAALLFLLDFVKNKETQTSKILIFVATKHHVEFLSQILYLYQKVPIAAIYGSMDPERRNEQMQRFIKGVCKTMVVTDVAARGLDLPYLDLIVNFDFPTSSKLFCHRVGRTARAGRSGKAYSFVTPEDLPYTMELLLSLGRKLKWPTTGTTPSEIENLHSEVYIGGMPDLSLPAEFIETEFKQNSDLVSLEKSMKAATTLYRKSRASASRQSVERAKELYNSVQDNCVPLFSTLHPVFDKLTSNDPMSTEFDWYQHMKTFRPSTKKTHLQCISDSTLSEMKKSKQNHELFHIKTTKGLNSILQSKSEKPQSSIMHFESKTYESVHDEIEAAAFELMPDEEKNIKQTQFQKKRWNAQKRNYCYESTFHKNKKKVNESGVKVRGKLARSGLYQKWIQKSRKSIQNVGDVDNYKNSGPSHLMRTSKSSSTSTAENKATTELKSSLQIAKSRRQKSKNDLRQNKNSKKAVKQKKIAKQKWESKQRHKFAQRAKPNRSILIRKTPKKSRKGKY